MTLAQYICVYSVYIHTCIYTSHVYAYTHTHTYRNTGAENSIQSLLKI